MEAARLTYTRVAIALHWGIGLLVIANLVTGFFHENLGEAGQRLAMTFHKASGITILVLSVARLGWRLSHRPPPLAPTVKRWEKGLAHATHWAFYVLMILVPLSGWVFVSAGARKYPIDYFGLFQVPWLPVAQDKDFSHIMNERHEQLAILWLLLLVMHVGAALKHHLMDKDDTLHRMAPAIDAPEAFPAP